MKLIRSILVLSVWTILSAGHQDTFFQTLRLKFEKFNEASPFTTLEFIFDQDRYLPGDTAFLRINFLDAMTRPRKGRDMLGVTISDENGLSVLKTNFVVMDGVASSYVKIPAKLSPGVYKICAFDNTPESNLLLATLLTVVGEKIVLPKTSVSFFPEGGRLVANISNHVVMRVTGHSGVKNMSVQISDGIHAIKNLEVEKNGLLTFDFIPKAGPSYFAEFRREDDVIRIPMNVSPDGCSLHIDRENENFRVALRIPETSKYQNRSLFLQVANKGSLSFQKEVIASGNEDIIVSIPGGELLPGISQLSVFDAEFDNIANELIFKPFQLNTNLTGLKDNYHVRDRVDFSIALLDEPGHSNLQSCIVSVVKKDLFLNDRRFPNATDESSDQTELITRADLIDWKKILNSEKPLVLKMPSAVKELTGRVFFTDTGLPVQDSTLITGILTNDLIAYETYTSDSGHFTIKFLYDFEGEDELFYVISHGGQELHNVTLQLGSESRPDCGMTERFYQGDKDEPYWKYEKKRKQVIQAFESQGRSKPARIDWNNKFEDEFMGADSETNLDKFLLMPTMEEIIKEIVPMLHVRRVEGNPAVRVVLYSEEKIPPVAIDDPLYCIDGELTKNSSYFLHLNPADVRKIKLIVRKEKLERFGMLGRNGVVIVETKRTKPEQIPNSASIPVTGVTKSLAPAFPDYSKPSNKRKPDFRPSLYFGSFLVNPKSNISKPVTQAFYTSDDVGEYVLTVRGLTQDGAVFYIEKTFNVSF